MFLEIESPELRGVLFLPDFTIQKGPKSLLLEMKGVKGARLTLTAPDDLIVDTFMSFVAAFPQFRDTLLQQVRDLPIEYEERFGEDYVKVTSDLTLHWTTKGKEMSLKMGRRTGARLSPLGKELRLGVSDGERSYWIRIPEFKSLCTWYCVMLACIERVREMAPVRVRPPVPIPTSDTSQVPSMGAPKKASPAKARAKAPRKEPLPAMKPEPEPVPVPTPDPDPDLGIEINIEDIEIETVETEPVEPPPPEPEVVVPEQKERGVPARARGRRRLSVNQRKMDQVREMVRTMQISLQSQLDAYQPAVVAGENVDEPQLVFPSGPKFEVEQFEYVEHKKERKEKMTIDELKSDVSLRVCNAPRVNYARYNPKFKKPKVNLRNVVYDPKSPESFLVTYEKANPKDAFVLILSMLSNGSIPSSEIADAFGVPTKGSTQDDLISVVEAFGAGVFKKLLEMDVNWDNCYLASSMISDRELIEELSRMEKQVEKPDQIPEKLPFQEPMNPVRAVKQWYNDTIYQMKIHKLRVKHVVLNLGKCLGDLFSSYLIEGKTLDMFMKDIYDSGVIIGAWSVFRAPQGDFETVWLHFWAHSFKDDKLTFNFCDLLKRKQIEKYYAPCAPVRNMERMKSVAEWLSFFETLGLSKQFDLQHYEDKSMKNLLARTAEWVGRFGFSTK